MKSQAAMEYLMTYGWAILVIAVVLAALYSLGIFNPNTFAPKASAFPFKGYHVTRGVSSIGSPPMPSWYNAVIWFAERV